MKDLKLSRLDRIKAGEDAMNIYRESVAEIIDCENENVFFNCEEQYFYKIDYIEQIEKAKIEKKLLALPRLSREYEFNLNRIYSYNELFREDFKAHSQIYYDYKKEIQKQFKMNDKDGKLTDILRNKYLMIQVEYEINHRSKDIDNIAKPFLDFLFANVPNSDNSVKRFTDNLSYKNEDSDQENIYFRIIVLNEEDIQLASIKRSIKNR